MTDSNRTGSTPLRTTSLGSLTVSAEGLGCMGMSEFYGDADWDSGIDTIRHALDQGVTLIDTADMYGSGHNEVLVGRAIAGRRDEVQLATKCGIDRSLGDDHRVMRGERAYVKRACEASLQRLGVDHIDLFYLHRPPQTAEIEEAVGAMSELVAEGKVGHLGLSEVDADILRRADAVHSIDAVQSEYSLWTRDPEDLAPVLSEIGAGLVAYSPLGRGFFTGALDLEALADDDFRAKQPRFAGEAGRANLELVRVAEEIAEAHSTTAAAVSLAWIMAQDDRLGVPVVPIPGTKRRERLEQNAAAVGLELGAEEIARLDALAPQVVGARY
ncbi:aldo/keto reductase [Brevibacterium sp. VCM10]|uniref:aldo/keto reductase n=1 Tax=Brevibacterium sp. VCM10 TaxID=1381751 RepID=UPI0004B8AF4C|nr:aldo/keto reductase [Brevibacterium sp. VCM10]